MKKLIAVTASLIAAASLSQASAVECKAGKISVSDLLDAVKNNSCVSVILPEIGNSESLRELLSQLLGQLKPILPEIPEEDADSDSSQPGETPEEQPGDSDTPSDTPSDKPENTPSDKPDDSTGGSENNNGSTHVSASVNAVLNLVNRYRLQNGLAAVSLDAALCGAADIRAKEIVSSFSHTRPNGSSCFTVLSENGISYRGAGENIAYGQSSPDEVMTAWMNSSGHRANILNPSFTKLGVGVYQNGGTLYWTQLFTY